jgi:hypothetical protein
MSDDQQHIVIVTTRVGGSDYHHQKKKQKFPDDESTGLLYFPCFQHSVWPSQLPLIGIQISSKSGFFDVKKCHVTCKSAGESSDESIRDHPNYLQWFIFRKTRQMTYPLFYL